MAYTLYTDRNEEFVCEIAVKNASLKNAFARMVVEAGDLTLMFPGQLKDGKCHVPIRRLKNLLEENATGNMHLEVVVEDTYFKPWEGTHNLSMVGNLYTREAGQSPYINTDGAWKINITNTVSTLVFKVETAASGSTDVNINPQEIAQAVWQYATTASLASDTFGSHVYTKILTLAQYMATK